METLDLKGVVKERVLNLLKEKVSAGELVPGDFSTATKDCCLGVINDIGQNMYEIIVQDKEIKLADYRKETNEFLERLNKDWGSGFDLFEIFIAISKELASDFIKDTSWERNELTMSLIRLQARGCQVASEVLVLLRNGFADGAFARWRTLHEISVVSLFLKKHGIESAKRYIAYDIVESYGIAKKEILCQSAMEYNGPTSHEMDALKNKVELVKTEFGKDIAEQNGWAYPYLGKRRVQFSDIEKDVDLDRFRRNYGIASCNVHASVKGVTFKLSLLDNSDVILAGPSNVGFGEPGHSSVISLLQINSTFLLYQEPTLAAIYLKILTILSNSIGNSLYTSHVEILKRYHGVGATIAGS